MHRAARLFLALAAVVVTSEAHAQGNATAEALFQEARVLVENGNYADACPKLAESQRLEPAVGTQFNLADCYEHLGRTATAHALFLEVASIARAAGKFERERGARERATALEPKLARVRVVVLGTPPGLEIKIDDKPLERAKWSTAFPIDPGPHHLSAAAPGRRPFDGSFEATASSAIETNVPELVEIAPPKTAAVAFAPAPAPEPARGGRTLAYVAAGVGLAALAAGSVAGVLSLSKRDDAERECPKDIYAFRCPTETGAAAWNEATTAGDIATVGFVVAGVALAGAAVLWLTSRPAPRARASASTLLLEGRF